MYHLSDIFIGDFPTENSGLGIIIKCPVSTPILAGADGRVSEAGFDGTKGNFITVIHDGFFTRYEHLEDLAVKIDDLVVKGQLVGHSGKTGVAAIPCLMFGLGAYSEDTGYGDFINPLGDQVQWTPELPKEPIIKAVVDEMRLNNKEYAALTAQAKNYRNIIGYLGMTLFPKFLQNEGKVPIDLELTPDDTTGGHSVADFIDRLIKNHKIKSEKLVAYEKRIIELEKQIKSQEKPIKRNLLQKLHITV